MQKRLNERAMMARINRKLATKGQKIVRTPPNSHWFNELGRFHIVDRNLNAITAHGIDDLEGLSKELGTLKPGEVI